MTHTNFQVGDRVKFLRDHEKIKKGFKGTIVNVWRTDNKTVVDVDWDDYVDGHTCEGLAKKGHGWNVFSDVVTLVGLDSNINPANLKYIAIIRKSKQLNERFENRKKGTEYAF